MADKKYYTLSEEAINKLCSLVRESHSVADAIDDKSITSDSTYSSLKITELLELAGVQVKELTSEQYNALSEEEQKNGTVYFIADANNDGAVIGYTGGTGITVSEDKVIAIKDIKKNYIDNSNFRINQTGQSEYTASGSTIYTVDRWYIDGGTLAVVENGVQFTNPNTEAGSSSLIRLKQNIGYSFADFAGKTVTLSAKINDTVYTGTATIPTEKPTEGTAVQYIASGISDFGINLNYSITGDYFVPYLALAYGRIVVMEWMKLEVNDVFSGYIEPDYSTELIKMNMTTSDKGILKGIITTDSVVAQITDMSTNNEIPTAWAVKSLVDNLFPVVIEGSIAGHYDQEQTTVKELLSDRAFYLIALHNTNIPEDGYYFCMHKGQEIEVHRIVGDDLYGKVSGAFEKVNDSYGNYLTFYSSAASTLNYKVYKLPFFAD